MTREKIIIGADHAGYRLKAALIPVLEAAGLEIVDAGVNSEEPADYPDIAAPVAKAVSQGTFERGILICGSGAGMVITANRFRGVRAAVALDEDTARLSRLHNDTNILVLAGRKTTGLEAEAIVKTWLATPFEGGRHEQRLNKIARIEAALGL